MNKSKVIMYIIFYLFFFVIGVVVGMTYQQAITQATLMKVADNLEGVQVDIDLNETKIVEGITDFYTPLLEEMINISRRDAKEVKNE